MKMALRSRLDHSRSSDLKRKRNQATTIVRQGDRKTSPSSDNPPNCRYALALSLSLSLSLQPLLFLFRYVPKRRMLYLVWKGPKPYHKANWDWENTRIYLELVVKEIDTGNRPHMSINPNGYRSLAKTYEAATGLTHSMKQLKNRYNQLKAEWRAWSKLMDSRKGPTGIGFDQETRLINASDEWWATMEKLLEPLDGRCDDDGGGLRGGEGTVTGKKCPKGLSGIFCKVDKECCKFRTKCMDHEELMRRVFTGAAATGKNAWTPSEMQNQLEVEGESDSADFSTDSNELGASETTNLMKSATINALGSGSKRRHSFVTAVQKKRITEAKALATSMDDLVNSVKTQSKELTVNHVVGGQSVTMAEAVGHLYEIQGLDQSNPLLHFGISLMEVPNNRKMVMSIPSDAGIIGWLQVKQQDKDRTTTVPPLASILSNQGLRF
ncbi:L10-interacting MYB domain-containing protein [Camellia lanceoleosa]|uniref:L10-interacting MYB domain-containing protein n=1 Tax=Camellia lanceoleosa TaxID=1840588 RepID=A0ACC0IBH8_9ERIC|nr:L10-interacting MYB domain-containing protein [Camellia lanceoleosa]